MNESQQRIFSQETKSTLLGLADRRREPTTRNARPVYVRSAESRDVRFDDVRTVTNSSTSIQWSDWDAEGIFSEAQPGFAPGVPNSNAKAIHILIGKKPTK
jgi:hypothetical protein